MAHAAVMNDVAEDQTFAYDVFLSYNSAQKDWTRALAARLRKDNFRVFFDEWEMPKYLGQNWIDVLAKSVEQSRWVVLVLSPEFFSSEWPQFELNVLQTQDPNGTKRKILPLIHTKYDPPKRVTFLHGLPFSLAEDESRAAEAGSIDFEFRYQQLLYNLDRTRQYEGDFEEFKTLYQERQLRKNQTRVINADTRRLTPEGQTSQLFELRSVLYQAPRYSTPTYFLDPHLAVVHWNVAFELIFQPILPAIRRHHVNHFIVELANQDEVFDHARVFTDKVNEEGQLPLVDLEPLVYESPDYGRVEFIKVATQLADGDANLKAWSVSLLLKKIDWPLYLRDLEERLREDRLWGLYAVSYDAILRGFKPYEDLIQDVIGPIPSWAMRVLELGAGTGNVTERLLGRDYNVLAVENNSFMLEKMAAKGMCSSKKLTILMESVENTEFDNQRNFDAAVAVNVAYALEDPLRCFRRVADALKRGGIFSLSTTHSNTNLDALLHAIRADLEAKGKLTDCREHYDRVVSVNRAIEKTIAKRYSVEQYTEWLVDAGFQIVCSQPKYFDAVEVIHARKV
jgi:SAM-dependent methyltransferase